MSDEFGPSFITLTDEDGNDIELEYVDALEHEGQTYMAFFPAVEDEAEEESEDYGLVILKSVTENGEELLSTLDDEAELEKIRAFFTAWGRTMPENNKKQAMVPTKGHKLPNAHGTAPGAWFEDRKSVV